MVDSLPLWFAIPAIIAGWSWLIVSSIRNAAPDPDPRWSQLDCWDGLDSRTG